MDKKETKPRGRPKGSSSENPATKTLAGVRVTADKLNNYKQAASKSGVSFSAWVRNALDKACKKK